MTSRTASKRTRARRGTRAAAADPHREDLRLLGRMPGDVDRHLTIWHTLAGNSAQRLLEDSSQLERSIQDRTPYLDPLNHLQVGLLRRHRAGRSDERTCRSIHLTINGLAAGSRNGG